MKLAKVVDVKGGKRLPSGAAFSTEPTSHPYIRGQDIRGGRIRASEQFYITDDVFEKIRRYTVQVGDVCITIVGNIGDVGITPPELDGANLTENAVKLIPTTLNLDSRFLAYALLSPDAQQQMKLSAAGAAQPKLGIYKVNDIEIPFLQVERQRRIAAILSAYDDLIENNMRRIAILEEMARRIYEEWFVRFRFPGHEQTRMVESEVGPVPEGWRVCRLGDEIELAYGKALKAEDRVEGDIPVYGSSGVVGLHSFSLVDGPGIIVGRKGNVGSVHWCDVPFFPIDTVFYVKSALPLHFVFFNLQQQNFLNNDAAVPGLNRNQAYALPLLVPSPDLLARFANTCASLLGLTRVLSRKNHNLRTTRDLLLPRLISGELDVSDLPEPQAVVA
ncbi:restriction endonuclease subunit S [Metallibacterium scheffleri]|uniref:restriction endonuclease subunit S n=1 Tax=Metallibacterium scheffleri TaxID=993689 RepID=UPI001446B28A|nr:restriction endonuclease subunit S [Metallibacterium scheffleri]